tara:strand:+ start:98 stop:259 length:162 start_codon:yes stop_codon:yes gene_type:complete
MLLPNQEYLKFLLLHQELANLRSGFLLLEAEVVVHIMLVVAVLVLLVTSLVLL